MADPFKHVRPGEPFRVAATAWNAAVDAAKAEHLRGAGGGVLVGGTPRSGWVVKVKNETGGDLDRNSVVGLGGPIVTPDDGIDAFLRGVTFRGVTPTSSHTDRFAVLLDPAPADQVVRAYVAGVYAVQVDVTDEAHSCASAESGNTDSLVSSEFGPAQILWREGEDEPYGYGAGLQWAVVRRAAGCMPSEEEGEPQAPCCGLGVSAPQTLYFHWSYFTSAPPCPVFEEIEISVPLVYNPSYTFPFSGVVGRAWVGCELFLNQRNPVGGGPFGTCVSTPHWFIFTDDDDARTYYGVNPNVSCVNVIWHKKYPHGSDPISASYAGTCDDIPGPLEGPNGSPRWSANVLAFDDEITCDPISYISGGDYYVNETP